MDLDKITEATKAIRSVVNREDMRDMSWNSIDGWIGAIEREIAPPTNRVQQNVMPALIDALRYYADKENYDEEHAPGNLKGHPSGLDVWEFDKGEIARDALALIEKQDNDLANLAANNTTRNRI